MDGTITFENPSFSRRLSGMLGVDFYRLFHTPMFYIFLAIAAIIPAMILGMGGNDGGSLVSNTWEMVAARSPIYVISDIGEYANMNMVFIFGGICVSIFIGHDYKSGYVKQLFTTHAKKRDYMMSKSISCAFIMACMCMTYLFGTVLAGLLTGSEMSANAPSLILAILGKIVMSLGWASLFTFINIIFRRYFGISIAASFFLGTGILIIGVSAALGEGPLLNMFLYGSSVNACLSSRPITLLTCLIVSICWSLVYNLLGSMVLAGSDVY